MQNNNNYPVDNLNVIDAVNAVDYNVNVVPLLASYNHTNQGVSPLITSDNKNYDSLVDLEVMDYIIQHHYIYKQLIEVMLFQK